MTKRLLLNCLFLLATLGLTAQIAPEQLSNVEYRNIGPARGGRVTAVAGHADHPFTFYFGSTGGGVWKSTDAGLSWNNISDGYFSVGSIGAITVAPSDPNVVYVGTGAADMRGNVSIGKGMYKSTDAGDTWTFIGLPKAGQISQVAVHPNDPDVVYVAALGNPFGPNPERGVYRSTNGGNTWEQLLFVNNRTGAVDLVMDPNNPRILYAGFWTVERKPWTLIDGSDDGGVWKSTDGGEKWTRLEGGLPTGLQGRVGIAVSPANSQRVWVIQETAKEEDGGVYRSDDGGKTFRRINRDHNLRQRHWYYTRIFADPQDEHTVYVVNVGFHKSIDGGKNYSRIRVPHGDNHVLWINPDNPNIMIEGNDGGACVTFNGGETWTTQNNQPTAEFYRVSVDNQWPYRVYGAQQDNSTMSVPSLPQADQMPTQEWYSVGGGESGHIAVDPRDPDLIYAGNYIGQITRLDRERWHKRDIVAYPQMHDGTAPRDIRYRFQWNAPIRLSPHDPNVLYHCSQYVHRTSDGGRTWEVISPDLTTNNDAYQDIPGGPIQHDHTGVELYTTIFSFEESPQNQGELWAGSDDGLVHLSRDNGETWTDITPANMPEGGTVNTIELSAHDPARAFLAVYKYRENDFRPYIFMTNNYGQNWTLLTDGNNGIPDDHFVRVVREDPQRKGLLYAGTEFGMYISYDEGQNWQSLQLNLPVTPITDMLIKNDDLVLSTQGRSFWILDNLSPFQELTENALAQKAALLTPHTAYRTQLRNYYGASGIDRAALGATIDFYLAPEMTRDSIVLAIVDPFGRTRRVFSTRSSGEDTERLPVKAGLNRFEWDLRYEAPEVLENAVFSLAYTGRMKATAGAHTVRLTVGDSIALEAPLSVEPDPRWEQTVEDLQAQHDLTVEVMQLLNTCHGLIGDIHHLRSQIEASAQKLEKFGKSSTGYDVLSGQVVDQLTDMELKLIQTKSESGQDPINYPSMLDDQMAYLYSIVNGQDARPTQGAYDRYEDLQDEFEVFLQQFEVIKQNEVPQLNQMLERARVKLIEVNY